MTSSGVPATLSRVVIDVNDRVSGDNRAMALHAGLVGVAQDGDGGLRPVAGWYLAPARVEIDDVVERVVREHDTAPPQPGFMLHATAELAAIYHRIGSATLFGGAWRLLPIAGHGRIPRGNGRRFIVTIMELPGGRRLGAAVDSIAATMHWLVCRAEEVESASPGRPERLLRLLDEPADVRVYGTSLALLLQAVLDNGGDITHLETGRLDQLDSLDRAAAAPVDRLGQIRAAKEAAIEEEDFERAAQLRDREKALLLAQRGQTRPLPPY